MKETTSVSMTTGQNGDASTIKQTIIATGQESSVEIATNAKGQARVLVKAYHADAKQAENEALDIYMSTIKRLYDMRQATDLHIEK